MPTRPFIPVAGVFRCQLVYSYQGQRIENVFNVRSGGGLVAVDADRIEAVLAAWWTATARAQCASTLSLVLIVLDALDVPAGLHKEYTSGWTAAGSNAGTAMPGNVTACVKLATGLRGRSYRGRWYWPAITSGMTNGGQLSSVSQLAIQSALNLLRTNLAAGSPADHLVVVSYMHDGVWRATGTVTDVTACTGHLNLDSQRRRLPGRGL